VPAFAALYNSLHYTRENPVNNRRITCIVLTTHDRNRFSVVRSVKSRPVLQSLLVLKLLEKVNHEFVRVVLLDGIETPSEEVLKRGFDHPTFVTGRLRVHDVIEFMDPIAEIKVVAAVCRPILDDIKVPLHHIVVTEFLNR
jgi:hypothetical protein